MVDGTGVMIMVMVADGTGVMIMVMVVDGAGVMMTVVVVVEMVMLKWMLLMMWVICG